MLHTNQHRSHITAAIYNYSEWADSGKIVHVHENIIIIMLLKQI